MVVNEFVLLKVDSSIWWGQDISLRGQLSCGQFPFKKIRFFSYDNLVNCIDKILRILNGLIRLQYIIMQLQ